VWLLVFEITQQHRNGPGENRGGVHPGSLLGWHCGKTHRPIQDIAMKDCSNRPCRKVPLNTIGWVFFFPFLLFLASGFSSENEWGTGSWPPYLITVPFLTLFHRMELEGRSWRIWVCCVLVACRKVVASCMSCYLAFSGLLCICLVSAGTASAHFQRRGMSVCTSICIIKICHSITNKK
jgi:hypothetical protein